MEFFNEQDKHNLSVRISIVLIVLIGIIIYSNSFAGVFLFDDVPDIVRNTKIRTLAWPWTFWENTRRPLFWLTLALNYALGQLKPFGYHFLNLSVHILAALLLFGIIRRTCLLPRIPHSLKNDSTGFALTAALIWLAHPLQTQSVTYIMQRAESLMGMFYLLTVYAAMRYMTSRRLLWGLLSILACLLGGLTKEVMVTAPIVILLYDRAFVSRSFREAVIQHRILYGGFALFWAVMFFIFFTTQPGPVPTAEFSSVKNTPLQYALTQPAVVLHYLRLAIIPYPLLIDKYWPTADSMAAIVPALFIILILLGMAVWAYRRFPGTGFLAITFFIILCVTSGFIPLQDLAFEHRMYLPLVCVILLVVLGARYVLFKLIVAAPWQKGMAILLTCAAIGTFGYMTFQRNKDYHSVLVMWQDVVKKRPANCRANSNFAMYLVAHDRNDEAVTYYQKALSSCPGFAVAHNNLGVLMVKLKRFEEGLVHYSNAIRINPDYAAAYNNIGVALILTEREHLAEPYLKKALQINPDYPKALNSLGVVFKKQGKFKEALGQFSRALELEPWYLDAQRNIEEIMALGFPLSSP